MPRSGSWSWGLGDRVVWPSQRPDFAVVWVKTVTDSDLFIVAIQLARTEALATYRCIIFYITLGL